MSEKPEKYHGKPKYDEEAAKNDPMYRDKFFLRASQAGMRFMAQTHIYNSLNWERLRQFITDSYHEEQLEQQAIDERIQVFQTFYEKVGRVKIKQVVGTHEERVVVVVETEKGDPQYFLVDIAVEEDYPHKIIAYSHQVMNPTEE
jgi:hypothetical protein